MRVSVPIASLIGWLNNRLEDLTCFGAVPQNRPERFITVERVGGANDRLFDYPVYAVQVWATSIEEADRLAGQLCDECLKLALEPWVANIAVGSLSNFTDPASRHIRYQFTLELQTILVPDKH